MTPEPVSPPPLTWTLIETTAGSTLAATPASDLGSLATLPETGATVRPALLVVGELLPPAISAPTPTPIPPKTSAARPAATALARHGRPGRSGRPGGTGGSVPPARSPLPASVGGQNRSLLIEILRGVEDQTREEG